MLSPRQFTGELNLFSSRASLVTERASLPTRMLRVRRSSLRSLARGEPEIGELLLRAFVLRRMAILRHKAAGVTLIGMPDDADMLRMREFLVRNGYPHQLLSPEARDEEGRLIVEQLGLQPGDLPAVVDSRNRIEESADSAAGLRARSARRADAGAHL